MLFRSHRLFLEVSAHPVVSHSIVETLTSLGMDDHAVLPVLRRDQPQRRAVAAAVGALYPGFFVKCCDFRGVDTRKCLSCKE